MKLIFRWTKDDVIDVHVLPVIRRRPQNKIEKSVGQYTLEKWNELVASRSQECPVCLKSYRSPIKMRRHLRKIHSSLFSKEIRVIIEARIRTKNMGDYTLEEWREIVSTKSNQCPVCQKTYSSPSKMRRHLKEIHSTQKKCICDVCGKQFLTPDRVREHRKKIHEKGSEKFECDICKKVMRSKHSISDHMSLHTGDKLHHCKYCNESFGFSSELTRHIKHHKLLRGELDSKNIHECKICFTTFIEKYLYVRHMNWIHGDDKNTYNLCKICGRRCKNLNHHMLTHTKEMKVFCHICGMSLRRGLKRHMMTHTGEKPFACDVCGSTFRARSNLTRHMLKHGIERPFDCKICKKTFSTESAYNLHEQKHETDNVFKSNKCQICKIRFENDEALNSHYSEHFAVT